MLSPDVALCLARPVSLEMAGSCQRYCEEAFHFISLDWGGLNGGDILGSGWLVDAVSSDGVDGFTGERMEAEGGSPRHLDLPALKGF